MKLNYIKRILLLAALLGSLWSTADAQIVVVAPSSSGFGTLHVLNDINFMVTTTANAQLFVLKNWVTSDGFNTGSSGFGGAIFGDYDVYAYSINSGVPVPMINPVLNDNLAQSVGDLLANDGYLAGASFAVSTGNRVTLKAGFYGLTAVSGFNPMGTQTFTGTMFLADSNGVRISDFVTAVPEPSGVALGALGLFMLGKRRRG